MIYTVTLNPAVDYVVGAENIKTGGVNRAAFEEIYFGGKGINVSLILAELGYPSRALGFTAGFTGAAIEKGIAKKGVETDFVRLSGGFSRINVKIKSAGEITEINGGGPEIPEKAIEEFFGKLGGIEDGDFIVLSGSVPKSLPTDIYEQILARLSGKKIQSVVDASGDLLLKTLKFEPFLIKPNIFELEGLFGKELRSESEIVEAARKLQEKGALNVLVSLGAEGAILIDSDGAVHKRAACKGVAKNTVGAGDSMVAGFIAGCISGDYPYALELASACGGATAFSEGLATFDEITALME